MIHIVDYGLGNTQAFITMYRRLGIETKRALSSADLVGANKLILPGVGAFDYAMQLLNGSGMRPALEDLVVKQGVPVLGICVGMQMLADHSEEGVTSGLGWVPGHVRGFADRQESSSLPMPHMGWNDVLPEPDSALFKGFAEDARFYFLHSFYYDCLEKSHVSARADYGFNFECAVQNQNVFGVQFHPEKSHHWGAALLKNFADI